jgi:hypothetical protein
MSIGEQCQHKQPTGALASALRVLCKRIAISITQEAPESVYWFGNVQRI